MQITTPVNGFCVLESFFETSGTQSMPSLLKKTVSMMNDNRNLTTRGSTTIFQLCIVWKLSACRENKEGDVAIKSADQAGSIEE